MNEIIEDRRNFIKRITLAAAALPFLANCQIGTHAQKSGRGEILESIRKNGDALDPRIRGAMETPDDVSWRTVVAPVSDIGERIVINGTVYNADGKTPAPNTLIYLYHTDIYGHYGKKGEHPAGRYRGWMLTDRYGRYEFESIKPASYPDSTIAAHVHMTVTTATSREDWIDEILFEGDKFITAKQRRESGLRGGFDPILKMERGADGIMRGVRDIQLWA